MALNQSLNRLEVFITLAECKGFRECGRRLKRTQPSISRQIRELESELSKTLFIRDPHRVELTDEGRKLLLLVREPMGALLRALSHDSTVTEKTIAGTLSIGTLSEFGQSVLFEIVAEFCKVHPQVVPKVSFCEEALIREKLTKGEFDFGVVTRDFKMELIRCHSLIEERIALIGRKGATLPTGKGVQVPMVGYRDEDPLLEIFEQKFSRRKGPQARVACLVNSHATMIQALNMLDCFAYLPVSSAKRELRVGSVQEFGGFETRQTLYLAYPALEHESELRKLFRSHVLKRCRKIG